MTEVLETIAPPYSQEFVSLFLPLVENEEITGTMDKVNHSKHENSTKILGGFSYWSALKMTKCQTLRKF